jgi:hypothetical protein
VISKTVTHGVTHAERVLGLGYGGLHGGNHLEHGALTSGEGSDVDTITKQGVADEVSPVGAGEADEGDLRASHQDSRVMVVLNMLLG